MKVISHSVDNYSAFVQALLLRMPRDLAMCQAVGCQDEEEFRRSGDGQAAVLRHHGLVDGMTVYDLGCGSGRTAQALRRSGWNGRYIGVDVVPELVRHLRETCPGFLAAVHCELTVVAPDAFLDMAFHWSVFTHLFAEECFLYLKDAYRALKPGGRLVFSFMELESEKHRRIFRESVGRFKAGQELGHIDTFLHRDWIRSWAAEIGFAPPQFTDGTDSSHHPAFWQSLVAMDKPAPAAQGR